MWLLLRRGEREFAFQGRLSRCAGRHVGVRFESLTPQQQVDLVQCTFARADAWLGWNNRYIEERPLRNFIDVLRLGGQGYVRLLEHVPPHLLPGARALRRTCGWLGSFLPRGPALPLNPVREP